MTLGRLLRTACHLSVEQILFSIVRRARHARWQRQPEAARARIAAAASQLAPPDPHRPVIAAIADQIQILQRTIHQEPISDLREGRFRIYGQAFPVADWRRFNWHDDTGEGNSPLRRLTLAYLGWTVPLLAEGAERDLDYVAQAVNGLDAVPWSLPGIFRDLWNPYTASHRLINLICALHLYRRGGGGECKAVPLLLGHVRRCAAFVLRDPERDIQANHLLKNWTALAVYAAATAAPERAFPALTGDVGRALDQLVLADGVHAERSPMYHALGLMDVELLRASGAVPHLHPRLDDAARRMRGALGVLTHPDGDIALFNDAWFGGAPRVADLAIDRAAPGLRVLPVAGYTRLDGDQDVVIFDSGPPALDCQPGHAHADFLSFELSVASTRLIVDPGTATYTAGVLRERTRSAASHNGPHILGQEPLELWQSFRIGYRGSSGALGGDRLGSIAPLWCAGWHNGYRAAGEVRRWIGLWPGQGLLIVDLWPAVDPATCRSRFLVPREWRCQAVHGAHQFHGAAEIKARALCGTLGELQSDVWWPRYGADEPAATFEIKPTRIRTHLAAALALTWDTGLPLPSLAAIEDLVSHLAAAPRRKAELA